MPIKDKEKRSAFKRKLYQQNTDALKALREVPCHDCGQEFPYYVMEFDHTRGEKMFNVPALMASSVNSPRVQTELAKCDVVCANCHKIRTHTRRVAHLVVGEVS